ncbi:DUF4393 domain-containing protein [Propionivibrio soli]|uniref:DUF4393 domain-containing protein n=1 Tax=Propionivibrio soli TaxID=2976531 RepID=UPI0021E8A70A|nr:DUF4393 domain-containing protein [Propionivibrio soli]
MEEEAKAVQEVAKTTGKAIDAAREAGGFIATFIAGPIEQGIGIFEDRLRYMRWERQIRLMQRAQDFLRAAGLPAPTRPVPLKLLIPIMQGASLEENDDLQDRWAALLVNAANANFHSEVRRSYAVILEQLTPLDAQILDVLYALPFEKSQHDGITTADLPVHARIKEEKELQFALPSDEVVISLSNLARLGCLRPGMTWGGGESFGRVNPTVAGKAFVEACRAYGT